MTLIGSPSSSAPVRLEEFGDYQCMDWYVSPSSRCDGVPPAIQQYIAPLTPAYSGMAYPIISQVLEMFGPSNVRASAPSPSLS